MMRVLVIAMALVGLIGFGRRSPSCCAMAVGQDLRDVGDVVEKFTATPRPAGVTSRSGASSSEWGRARDPSLRL